MQSKARTVDAYLAELPPDRRDAMQRVREVLLKSMDAKGGYAEAMQYGMLCIVVPHSVYPPGYHCDPSLPVAFIGLASQKQYMSLYMGGEYCGCVDRTGKETAESR